MDWLAMVSSFPTILLAFYFGWQQTHNSISMVISVGVYLPGKQNSYQGKKMSGHPIFQLITAIYGAQSG
jgi:glucose-6-phosphate-specific signal transduction histidine kinase